MRFPLSRLRERVGVRVFAFRRALVFNGVQRNPESISALTLRNSANSAPLR